MRSLQLLHVSHTNDWREVVTGMQHVLNVHIMCRYMHIEVCTCSVCIFTGTLIDSLSSKDGVIISKFILILVLDRKSVV